MRFDEAARELDAALTARPDEPRYLLAQIRLLQAQSRASKASPEATTQAVPRALVDRLARTAVSAVQLAEVSEWRRRQDGPSKGLPFAEGAIHTDPTCWSCQEEYAHALFDHLRPDEALAAIDRAIALMPETLAGKAVLEQRRELEAFAAQPYAPILRTWSGGGADQSKALQATNPGIEACYRAELSVDPGAKGYAWLSIEVGAGGGVVAASIRESDLAARMQECLSSVARRGVFAPPQGGSGTVAIRMRFGYRSPAGKH